VGNKSRELRRIRVVGWNDDPFQDLFMRPLLRPTSLTHRAKGMTAAPIPIESIVIRR
jgi:hypothetical protein